MSSLADYLDDSALLSLSMLMQLPAKLCRRAVKGTLDLFYKPRGISELSIGGQNGRQDHKVSVDVGESSRLHVYVLHNARVHTDGGPSIAAIDQQNNLVAGASWQYVDRQFGEPRQNNIFRKGVGALPQYYDGTIFSMLTGGGANNNYHHWLYDSIPRLHLVREAGLDHGIDYYLVPALSYRFQHETLNCLGIPANRIISSLEKPHIKARRLVITDHPRPHHNDTNPEVPGWICQELRRAFLKTQEPLKLASDRLYISRRDSDKRGILNEEALIEALQRQGFVPVCLTDYSFQQQVWMFANASAVVSGHGAGLTNLTFCRPGTRVVELFNPSFRFRCYENISARLGLVYKPVICAAAADAAVHPNLRSIGVNVADVLEAVRA